MKEFKAVKVETFYGKHSNICVYEYRGHKYEVEYATDWTYCCTKPKVQHKIEQSKIDEMIAKPKSDFVGEPAEVGLELFFNYFES